MRAAPCLPRAGARWHLPCDLVLRQAQDEGKRAAAHFQPCRPIHGLVLSLSKYEAGLDASASAARQSREQIEPARDERFLLGAGPAFELALGGNGIGQTIEALRPDQVHRAPALRVAVRRLLDCAAIREPR